MDVSCIPLFKVSSCVVRFCYLVMHFYPGAVGEAAYMTGFERNADIVFAASYAPLLMNVANYQWASFTPSSFSSSLLTTALDA